MNLPDRKRRKDPRRIRARSAGAKGIAEKPESSTGARGEVSEVQESDCTYGVAHGRISPTRTRKVRAHKNTRAPSSRRLDS